MHLDHPHLVGIAASAHSDCGAEDIKLFENSGRLAHQPSFHLLYLQSHHIGKAGSINGCKHGDVKVSFGVGTV